MPQILGSQKFDFRIYKNPPQLIILTHQHLFYIRSSQSFLLAYHCVKFNNLNMTPIFSLGI
jgi:hypothetical protein